MKEVYVFFEDGELNTKSSEFPFYGLFPTKGGTTVDGMLSDIGIEQLQSLGIKGDIDLNEFVNLIKDVINSGDIVENDYYSDQGKEILERDRLQEEENMDKLLARFPRKSFKRRSIRIYCSC